MHIELAGRSVAGRIGALMLTAAALGASPRPGVAQAPAAERAATGPTALTARTFELRARAGSTRQFEDGYRRHLDWHLTAGDRWAWYLWEVTNGERVGLVVDGTFHHPWSDYDAAVDPRGDGADNQLNVEPFVMRGANHAWRLRRDLGPASGDAVVDPESAPLVLRTEYRVRPGAGDAFVRAMRQFSTAAAGHLYAVYELVSGGELPTYVVWVPVATWADAGAFADRTATAAMRLVESAERVRAELWRFRPDLSICRAASTRCYRTVPRGEREGQLPSEQRHDRDGSRGLARQQRQRHELAGAGIDHHGEEDRLEGGEPETGRGNAERARDREIADDDRHAGADAGPQRRLARH